MKRRKSSGEHLAFLTVKYDVHPDVLFCALLAAGEMGKAKCGPLSIECRGRVGDKTYFLIKEGSSVVSQIPVTQRLLTSKGNPVRAFMEADVVQNCKPEKPKEEIYSNISELTIRKRHVNLRAEVVDVSKPTQVHTKFGNKAQLAKALLKDNTGEIKLCLWNGLVDAVSAGDNVEIRNATVTEFAGTKQLFLGNKGDLKVQELQQEQSKSA